MTETYRQAVITFVNCNEKITMALDAAKKNINAWSIEKIKTTERICKELDKQRANAKEAILSGVKDEALTQEESDWLCEKLKPYIRLRG